MCTGERTLTALSSDFWISYYCSRRDLVVLMASSMEMSAEYSTAVMRRTFTIINKGIENNTKNILYQSMEEFKPSVLSTIHYQGGGEQSM